MANSKQHKDSGRKTNQLILIFCAVVIIILLAVVIALLVRRGGDAAGVSGEPKRNVVVNTENAESMAEQMVEDAVEYVEPGYYTVNMATEWHFSKGDAISSDARVDNVIENTNDVYFDVFLEDDESEAIYKSPVIPRGSFLENIALDKPLEKGTYDCVMVYHLIDDNQDTISTLRVTIQIVVEA